MATLAATAIQRRDLARVRVPLARDVDERGWKVASVTPELGGVASCCVDPATRLAALAGAS
jgi:hypothetical protein